VSADILCWLPILGLLPGSPDFSTKLEQIQESHYVSRLPAPELVEFVDTLLKRYPEQTEDITSVWADAPLKGDIIGDFVDIPVLWDY
jgi:hypothetical protein